MKIIADYHTHTLYSDGKGTIEDNVKAAIAANLQTIGITDHGYQHMGFGVKYENIKIMRDEIDKLKEIYPEIQILLGVECNILSDRGDIDMDDNIRPYFDYIMAGYHFGSKPTKFARGIRNHFNNFLSPLKHFEMEYNTRALINAMKQNDLFVLTHPGDKGDVDIVRVAAAAKETDTLLEINAHHRNLSVEQLKSIRNMGNKFIIGSDAHLPKNIGKVEASIQRAIEAGINLSDIVNLR